MHAHVYVCCPVWLACRYYAYEFDWIHDVVTIKQSKALTKFEKWWLSKPMCIEGGRCVSCMYMYMSFFFAAVRVHVCAIYALRSLHVHVHVCAIYALRSIHVHVCAIYALRSIHVHVCAIYALRSIHVHVCAIYALRSIHVHVCAICIKINTCTCMCHICIKINTCTCMCHMH